jgi:hypothetical protein
MLKKSLQIVTGSVLALWAVGIVPNGVARAADVGEIFGVRAEGTQLVVRVVDLSANTAVPDGTQLLTIPGRTNQQLGAITVLPNRRLVLWNTVTDTSGTPQVHLDSLGTVEQFNQLKGVQTSALTSDLASVPPQVQQVQLQGKDPLQPLGSFAQHPSLGLITLAGRREDTPPFSLSILNSATGSTQPVAVTLSPQARFSNLATCPDGATYGTTMTSGSGTLLARLDLAQKTFDVAAQLLFQGNRLGRDLSGLVCSATGQLYALSDLTRDGFNSLWKVDATNGDLQLFQKFDVVRITYAN